MPPKKGVVPPALKAYHTKLMAYKKAHPSLTLKQCMYKLNPKPNKK